MNYQDIADWLSIEHGEAIAEMSSNVSVIPFSKKSRAFNRAHHRAQAINELRDRCRNQRYNIIPS